MFWTSGRKIYVIGFFSKHLQGYKQSENSKTREVQVPQMRNMNPNMTCKTI
jgi:hypothetical protein